MSNIHKILIITVIFILIGIFSFILIFSDFFYFKNFGLININLENKYKREISLIAEQIESYLLTVQQNEIEEFLKKINFNKFLNKQSSREVDLNEEFSIAKSFIVSSKYQLEKIKIVDNYRKIVFSTDENEILKKGNYLTFYSKDSIENIDFLYEFKKGKLCFIFDNENGFFIIKMNIRENNEPVGVILFYYKNTFFNDIIRRLDLFDFKRVYYVNNNIIIIEKPAFVDEKALMGYDIKGNKIREIIFQDRFGNEIVKLYRIFYKELAKADLFVCRFIDNDVFKLKKTQVIILFYFFLFSIYLLVLLIALFKKTEVQKAKDRMALFVASLLEEVIEAKTREELETIYKHLSIKKGNILEDIFLRFKKLKDDDKRKLEEELDTLFNRIAESFKKRELLYKEESNFDKLETLLEKFISTIAQKGIIVSDSYRREQSITSATSEEAVQETFDKGQEIEEIEEVQEVQGEALEQVEESIKVKGAPLTEEVQEGLKVQTLEEAEKVEEIEEIKVAEEEALVDETQELLEKEKMSKVEEEEKAEEIQMFEEIEEVNKEARGEYKEAKEHLEEEFKEREVREVELNKEESYQDVRKPELLEEKEEIIEESEIEFEVGEKETQVEEIIGAGKSTEEEMKQSEKTEEVEKESDFLESEIEKLQEAEYIEDIFKQDMMEEKEFPVLKESEKKDETIEELEIEEGKGNFIDTEEILKISKVDSIEKIEEILYISDKKEEIKDELKEEKFNFEESVEVIETKEEKIFDISHKIYEDKYIDIEPKEKVETEIIEEKEEKDNIDLLIEEEIVKESIPDEIAIEIKEKSLDAGIEEVPKIPVSFYESREEKKDELAGAIKDLLEEEEVDIIEEISKILEAVKAFLLINKEKENFSVIKSKGLNITINNFVINKENDLVEHLFTTKRVVYVSDLKKVNKIFMNQETEILFESTKSLLIYPIIILGKIRALLLLSFNKDMIDELEKIIDVLDKKEKEIKKLVTSELL